MDVFADLRRVVTEEITLEWLAEPPSAQSSNRIYDDSSGSRRQRFLDLLHDCEVAAVANGYKPDVVANRIKRLDTAMLVFVGGNDGNSIVMDHWRMAFVKSCKGGAVPNVDQFFQEYQAGILDALELVERMKPETAPKEQPEQPSIIDLSNRLYRIGVKEQLVSRAEDDVLQAFLDSPALDSADLVSATESDRAPRVLRELCTKYDGIFAPAITLAGRKGAGYVVRISAPE